MKALSRHVWAMALVAAQAGAAALSWWHLTRLERVEPGQPPPQRWPTVSVIIPARNEEQRLPALLRSLSSLGYSPMEVLVVDDHSSDGTTAVASAFPVRLVRVEPLPPGWTGKNFACWQGATVATGEWLLFMDADTEHAPGMLHAVVSMAVDRRLAMLSLLPRQRCETFWERLLLPFAYQQYVTGMGPPVRRSTAGVANGQYILCTASSYRAVGGHAAVRKSVIDDVALAQRYERHRLPTALARGEKVASVRMYEGLNDIAAGFGKNSFRFLLADPASGMLVMLATILASLPTGLLVFSAVLRRSSLFKLGMAGYVVCALGIVPWLRLFGVAPTLAFLHPLGATVFQGIAMRSAWQTVTGQRTTWKGRLVGGKETPSPRPPQPLIVTAPES